MTTLLSDDLTSQVPDFSGSDSVGLRISQAGEVINHFNLPEGKCTIGSSPSCQLRLGAGQARPLQCLVVRSGHDICVTKWAAGILLNGLDFTTAPLRVGDLLSIGDLRLEVFSTRSNKKSPETVQESAVALIDHLEAQVAAEVAEISQPPESTTEQVVFTQLTACETTVPSVSEADLAKLHSANQQARQRFRRLIAALRELRDEAHSLDQHVIVLTDQLQSAQQSQEQLAAELHQTQAVAAERESQFGEELDRAIAELSTSYEKTSTIEQSLQVVQSLNEHLQEQLSAQIAECENLQNSQSAYALEKEHFEQELASRESQFNQLHAELTQQRQTLEITIAESRQHNEALQNECDAIVGEHNRQAAELQKGLEASIHELHEQNESLRSQVEQICAARDSQFAELQSNFQASLAQLHRQNESLRDQTVEVNSERERQLAALRSEHEAAIAELNEQNESLRNQLVETSADRQREVAALQAEFQTSLSDLQQQNESLQHQVIEVAGERERQLAELRSGYEASVAELQGQNESLRIQLTETTVANERTILELEQDYASSVAEFQKQNDALHGQLNTSSAEHEQHLDSLRAELEQAQEAFREAKLVSEQPDPMVVELETELGALRLERQQIAEEKHRLSQQLEDSEKRVRLLEIDVRSANAEWQLAQNTATRLQDELITAEAHAADLDAKLADFQCSAEVERASECDHFAGDLATTRQQLSTREAALAEANAEGQQLRTQLDDLQQENTACHTQLTELHERFDDLQAKVTRDQSEHVRLTNELLVRDTRLAELSQELKQIEEKSTSELSQRDKRVAELHQAREDLAHKVDVSETRLSELAVKLQESEGQLRVETDTRESQLAELTQQIKRLQEKSRVDLSERESRLAEVTTELEVVRNKLNANSTAGEDRVDELVDALQKLEAKFTSELRVKDSRIAELADDLMRQQDKGSEEILIREARIEQLTELLKQTKEHLTSELNLQQSSVQEFETADSELRLREDRIAELTKELHQTQDQLADCAAQGERLSELYQQARADLASLAAAQSSRSAEEVLEDTLSPSDLLSTSPATPNDDPRDDEEPRIVRALASVATEPTDSESTEQSAELQPTSFLDRYSHIFDDDENNSAVKTIVLEHPISQPQSVELPEIAGDDSAALEDYMANMMKRVRGETSSDEITPPLSCELAAENAANFTNPVARMDTLTRRVSAPVEPVPTSEEKLIDLQQLKETSHKPPLPTSLSAMRELANSSARQAIAKHRKRRHFEGALSKLLVSGIAGSTAAYMLVTADNYLSPFFLAGCGVAIVSAYWGLKLIGILWEMIRDGINNDRTPAELAVQESALPIDGVAE